MVIEVVYKGYGLTCCTTYVLHIKSWIVSVEQALYFYLRLQNGRSQCAWLVCLFCECSNMDLCYSGKSCFTTVPGQTTGSWICQCPYQQHWVGSVQASPSNHLLANGKQTKQHFNICVIWVLLPSHWHSLLCEECSVCRVASFVLLLVQQPRNIDDCCLIAFDIVSYLDHSVSCWQSWWTSLHSIWLSSRAPGD